jgi:hypothetical protein
MLLGKIVPGKQYLLQRSRPIKSQNYVINCDLHGHIYPCMVNTGLNNAPLLRILSIQFFLHVIHYIIAWYAQISWTPTYHITMPAAWRE